MAIKHKAADFAKFWKAYKKADWNVSKVALESNVPYATWQHRIRSCKAAGYKEEGERVDKSRQTPVADLIRTMDVVREHEGHQVKAARALGISRSALQSRLWALQSKLGMTYAPDARILLLDIETAPNRAFVWGIWKQNINPDWIDANGYILCWTAKWLGEKESQFQRLTDGKHKTLLGPIHRMLGEASAVVHYNGTSFDIPTLNKEFLVHGFTPPSPYKQIDLLLTMRDRFRFPSNKLDYICKELDIGEKLRHEGPQLWLNCMEDKAEAWEKMEQYNRRDVELLEQLYKKLLPWIRRHPNVSAMQDLAMCPSCGSDNFKRDGIYLANLFKYERYRCGACGSWFRGTKTVTQRKGDRFVATA